MGCVGKRPTKCVCVMSVSVSQASVAVVKLLLNTVSVHTRVNTHNPHTCSLVVSHINEHINEHTVHRMGHLRNTQTIVCGADAGKSSGRQG